MRKVHVLPHPHADGSEARVPFRLVLAVLAALPFLFEGGLLLYARWAAILGRAPTVRTPVLDAIGDLARRGAVELTAFFRSVPWNKDVVLGIAAASFLVCALLLRVRRER